MKRSLFALYLLLASGGSVVAADSAGDGFTIRCDDVRVPSLSSVAVASALDNVGEIYRTRDTLLHEAKRLCKRTGVAEVRFVPYSEVAVEPLRSVAAR